MDTGEAPFLPPDRSVVWRGTLKMIWRMVASRSAVSYFGSGPLRHRSLCYFDPKHCPGVRGYVAITIDDAPCRLGNQNSMVPEVRALLHEHGAKATFMVMGRFIDGNESDLVDLLRDGHELGNHGLVDRPYHRDRPADFAQAVEECSGSIRTLQRLAQVEEVVRWFRAPHGKYTGEMAEVLVRQGLTNVMCDTYACCPVIQDGEYIGRFLSQRATDGSILLIHMPERGFREWCFPGLQHLLEGLQQRGFKAVTLSELARRASHTAPPTSTVPAVGARELEVCHGPTATNAGTEAPAPTVAPRLPCGSDRRSGPAKPGPMKLGPLQPLPGPTHSGLR